MSPVHNRSVRRGRRLATLVPLVHGVQAASTPLRPAPRGSIGEPRLQGQVRYRTVPLACFRQAQTRGRGPVPRASPPAGPPTTLGHGPADTGRYGTRTVPL